MNTPSLKKTTKAEAFRMFRANPDLGAFQMLWEMKESIPALIAEEVNNITDRAREGIQKEGVGKLQEVIDEHLPDMVSREIRATIDVLKEAQDGKTPTRGTDYWTRDDKKEIVRVVMGLIRVPEDGNPGKPGDNGKTPKAGVDYPSKRQVQDMIDARVDIALNGMESGEKLTKEDVARISGELTEKFDFKARAGEIARALETLQGGSQLDYYALRNRPGVKAYDEKGGTSRKMLRGGTGSGSEALYYDLTDLTDGVTKVFTIPANKRVLGVFGTQFPTNYRPVTDWTRTVTTLTLTDQVGAPETGQTLFIIYVPL